MPDKARPAVPPPDPLDRFGWGPNDIKIKTGRSGSQGFRSGGARRSPMPLTEERQEQIQMEETVSRREKTPDRSDEEWDFRRQIRRQIKKMKAAGIEVVMPNMDPDFRR